MNNLNPEKAFQQPDYTLYTRLFSAVMNVENAVRLLVYDNMKLLQSIKHFSNMPSILSIYPLRNLLEELQLKYNLEFYNAISNHLREFERCIRTLINEEVLRQPITEIYFLIHQAYIELDEADLQPLDDLITSKNKEFKNYLHSQIG